MAGRVGQRLGNYRLMQLLGQGGFAEVYLGEHVYLGTQAAIKVLSAQLADKDTITNFQQEARLIAKLIHPHIVRTLEFGVTDSTPFLVMDYAHQGTLRQRHAKGGKVPLATVVTYVQQIAEGLQYAHEQKIIHRDIKPENMLVGRDDQVLLSDFGIAVIAHSTRSRSVQDLAGTIPYMSPEQLQGYPCPASDQYALGIIVYEWLSGERPFKGTFTEVAAQHSLSMPPSLRGLVRISEEIEQVIFKALAKDWRQRFACIKDFAAALQQEYKAEYTATQHKAASTDIPDSLRSTTPAQLKSADLPTVLSSSQEASAISPQSTLAAQPLTSRNPFIRFFIAPSKKEEALFGFRLPSLPSLQRRHQEVWQRQIRLINLCWDSGIAALDLRFIGMNNSADMLTCLLCRITCPPHLNRAQFHDLCLASASHLQQQASDIGYQLEPLSDDGSLSHSIQPFAFQSLAEIRRLEEIFILEGAHDEYEIYVTYPWEWSIKGPLALHERLRHQSGNWLVSICLQPTQLSTREWQLLRHATSLAMNDLLMSGGLKGQATYHLYQKFVQRLQRPYLLHIGLAASTQKTLERVSKTLIDEIRITLPPSDFPVVQVPQSAHEWQQLMASLHTLEWLPWSNLRDGITDSARLRYLVDGQGASMIFYLPVALERLGEA